MTAQAIWTDALAEPGFQVRELTKTYVMGEVSVHDLRGEGIDPYTGAFLICNRDVAGMTDLRHPFRERLDRVRRHSPGEKIARRTARLRA